MSLELPASDEFVARTLHERDQMARELIGVLDDQIVRSREQIKNCFAQKKVLRRELKEVNKRLRKT